MDDYHRHPTTEPRGEADARAAALADYLRERAAAFSMWADVTGSQITASAGMALLDAAHIADAMMTNDPWKPPRFAPPSSARSRRRATA